MLSPNPLSLFCAILLCLPLALIFTISSHSSTLTTLTFTHRHVTVAQPSSPPPPPSPPPIESPSKPPPLPPPRSPPPIESPSTPPPSSSTPPIKPPKTLQKKSTFDQIINTTTHTTSLPRPPPQPKQLLPPPYPEDDEDDVELLKRASEVNPDPLGGPKKIAFLFLTTTPLPFAPIWEIFFNQTTQKDQYNIYIHTDPNLTKHSNNTDNPPFTGVFQGRVIPNAKPTRRNTPTLISAARRLLSHALLDDPNNYIFTLLSPSCIPLHSFNFTYTTLTNSNKSFIEILNNETTAYGRWAARGEHVMLPEIPLNIFRIGSQFWSLTRQHARMVVEDVKLWRKFQLPCVTIGTCYPEENYFPTLLSIMDPYNVVPTTLTNVNWRGTRNGHPKTYNGSEVDPDLIRWLRKTRPRYGVTGVNGSDVEIGQRWDPFLFARKFAINCVEPLLSLANDVLFKD